MNELEKIIYNNGERLIPDISHSEIEKQRHFASYNFFKKAIENDTIFKSNVPQILDLGCGVGYGCKMLSEIPHSFVTGVDCSICSTSYAENHYKTHNIEYKCVNLNSFIPLMDSYDYVVSRGVFEHIENAFDLIRQVKFNRLFMFDVPYNEKPGNPHHKLLGITESYFENFTNHHIFYEDIKGNIGNEKTPTTNMIMCVIDRRNT